jgi:hypothetical protein
MIDARLQEVGKILRTFNFLGQIMVGGFALSFPSRDGVKILLRVLEYVIR